jgi:hypothetical protein
MTIPRYSQAAAKWALRNVLPSLVFLGTGLGILVLLGGRWGVVGQAGFWTYAIVAALDAARLVLLFVTCVRMSFVPRDERPPEGIQWLSLAGQTVEFVGLLACTFVLYQKFLSIG